jgi:hypothetical protein
METGASLIHIFFVLVCDDARGPYLAWLLDFSSQVAAGLQVYRRRHAYGLVLVFPHFLQIKARLLVPALQVPGKREGRAV